MTDDTHSPAVEPRASGNEWVAGAPARAGLWVVSTRIAQRGLGVVRMVVLARLLTPEDFGLFAIALTSLAALESVTEAGVTPALIQRREQPQQLFHTAWTLGLVRRAFVVGSLLAAAPAIAGFFDAHEAGSVIRTMSAVLVLDALMNVALVELERDLRFARVSSVRIVGVIVETGAAVAAALVLRNVWALVIGAILGKAAEVVASYAVRRHRPRLELRSVHVRELLDFGRWVFLSRAGLFLATNLDDILVGRMLPTSSLGSYQLAYRLGSLPTTEFSHVLNRVAFPVYARTQTSIESTTLLVQRSTSIVASGALPVAAITAVLSEPLVMTILGPTWSDAVDPLRLLALYGALRAIGAVHGAAMLGLGRPDVEAKVVLIGVTNMAWILPIAIGAWGLTGAAAGMVAVSFLNRLLSSAATARVLSCKWGALIQPLLGSTVAASLAAGAAAAVVWSTNLSDLATLAMGVACAISGVAGFHWAALKVAPGLSAYHEFATILRQVWPSSARGDAR